MARRYRSRRPLTYHFRLYSVDGQPVSNGFAAEPVRQWCRENVRGYQINYYADWPHSSFLVQLANADDALHFKMRWSMDFTKPHHDFMWVNGPPTTPWFAPAGYTRGLNGSGKSIFTQGYIDSALAHYCRSDTDMMLLLSSVWRTKPFWEKYSLTPEPTIRASLLDVPGGAASLRREKHDDSEPAGPFLCPVEFAYTPPPRVTSAIDAILAEAEEPVWREDATKIAA